MVYRLDYCRVFRW